MIRQSISSRDPSGGRIDEVGGSLGSRGHDAQNSLARAICLIEAALDELSLTNTGRQSLDQAITEIEDAGRLIAAI